MAKSDYRKGVLPYQFVGIPKDILSMEEYHALPSSAKALMLDLMGQYTGKNNGRLCPAFEAMKRSGWTSKDTLSRAKAALLECSFVVLTRKGHAPRTAEWMGLTWWKLDYHPSMDVDPRQFPHLNFMKLTISDPNSGRNEAKRSDSVPRNPYRYSEKSALRPPESVPMGVSV